MPAAVFAGSLPTFRGVFTTPKEKLAKNPINKLIATVTWTSRAYTAMLEDALVLDPSCSRDTSRKLATLCAEIGRILRIVLDGCHARATTSPIPPSTIEARDVGQKELEELERNLHVMQEGMGGMSKTSPDFVPWETAFELLLHLAIQTASDSEPAPSLDNIPERVERLEHFREFLASDGFEANQHHCGLPMTFFMCEGPHVNVKARSSSSTPGPDGTGQQEKQSENEERVFVITTSSEHWRLRPLNRWAIDQSVARRRGLLEFYEKGTSFGKTILNDRQEFLTTVTRAAEAPKPPEAGDDGGEDDVFGTGTGTGAGTEAHAAIVAARAKAREDGLLTAVANQEAVQKWLIHKGPDRVQEHFGVCRAAAFALGHGVGFKARCYACRATFCHSMPPGAWLCEDLAAVTRHHGGDDDGGDDQCGGGRRSPGLVGGMKAAGGVQAGTLFGCAELPARVLCNKVARQAEAAAAAACLAP